MATLKEDLTLKFVTTTDGDIEETEFSSGDSVYVVKEWDRHYLVRDDDGHYYNVDKDKIEP
ncbi:MAG: hypothetical protein AAFX94_00330 [Myxococcota bacterium]